jgi:hypothetical protein
VCVASVLVLAASDPAAVSSAPFPDPLVLENGTPAYFGRGHLVNSAERGRV